MLELPEDYKLIKQMNWEECDIADYIGWKFEKVRCCNLWRHIPTGNYFVEARASQIGPEQLESAIGHIESICYGKSEEGRARVKCCYSELETRKSVMEKGKLVLEIEITWPEDTRDYGHAITRALHGYGSFS